jgi:hypothetical protein
MPTLLVNAFGSIRLGRARLGVLANRFFLFMLHLVVATINRAVNRVL